MIDAHIQAYVNRLKLANYRPESVLLKRKVLVQFARSLPAGTTPLAATRTDIETYLARDLAPTTRRLYLSTIRGFYGYAIDEGLLTDNPCRRVPSVRVPAGTPRPVDRQDLLRALAGADNRMRAWMLLMALGGLRCCEVARLRPQDILEEPGGTLLFLREVKGGQTDTVPAHPAVLEALALLPIRNGAWWDVTPRWVSQAMGNHLRACGVRSTPHSLRHFAGSTWWRASGHDLLTTARLLRHRSVTSSQVYVSLDPTRPSAVVNSIAV